MAREIAGDTGAVPEPVPGPIRRRPRGGSGRAAPAGAPAAAGTPAAADTAAAAGTAAAGGHGAPAALTSFWLGRTPYGPAWELQKELARGVRPGGSSGGRSHRHSGGRTPVASPGGSPDGSSGGSLGVMLLLEHPPTYTLGRNAREDDVLIPSFSPAGSTAGGDGEGSPGAAERVQVHRIDRGGGVTYHGPGQLVGYPIVHLPGRGLGVKEYIHRLEQGLINLLDEYGIRAGREEGLPGIWVEGRKIAAIGVRVSRGVTTHGFALNVHPDLSYFGGIIPCGLPHREPASMAQLLPPDEVPPLEEIQARAAVKVAEALGFAGAVSVRAPWPVDAGGLLREHRRLQLEHPVD